MDRLSPIHYRSQIVSEMETWMKLDSTGRVEMGNIADQ
ncbi:unnamed protein product, partial [marine sediment metagenome]